MDWLFPFKVNFVSNAELNVDNLTLPRPFLKRLAGEMGRQKSKMA